jgi:hypothetical protein
VTVSGLPGHSRLKGRAHNPFIQPKLKSGSSGGSTLTTPTTTTGGSGGTGTTGSGGTTTTGSGGTTTTPTGGGTTPSGGSGGPPIVPSHPPKPAPSGLSSTEAYDVTISITNSRHGVNKISALERLATLPSAQQPQLVELGVLKGGRRVLFAVQPGTSLGGPGTCTPGPIDCQVVSLGVDQIESISRKTSTGLVPLAMFAVTAISAHHYSSTRQADNARSAVSPVGRRLLSHSTASALNLFPYKPGLGAIVDLRNLSIGGM